jgi:branched-chain amino acid transport system substrate-binding protein
MGTSGMWNGWGRMVAVVVGLLIGFGLVSCHRQDQNVVRIGIALPLTGDSAAWGQQGRWGAEIAAHEINNSGGIQGKKLEIVFEDTRAIPRVAISALSKLISVDHVPAVVGDIVSQTSLAMAPIAERHKVVLMVPTASAPALSGAGPFIFRVWPSDVIEGTFLANWTEENHINRVCVMHIATDYGLGLSEIFQKRFEALGGSVLSVQSYAQDETDFRPYLARIKTLSPQAVYMISYYNDGALILRQAREIGLKVQFLGATAVESPELLKLAGNAADGLIYPTIADFDASNPTPIQKTFIDYFQTEFKTEPNWAATHVHDAVLVIADAMRAGAMSGEEIRQQIDHTPFFDGVTGRISFDRNGDVVGKKAVMKTVENGSFVILSNINPKATGK